MISEVITKEVIKPSIPTQNRLKCYNLSMLDRVNGPILMPLIFFYSNNHGLGPDVNTMITRLKKSLSVTLTKFYPLAGRVTDQSHVDCNDEGVPYLQTRVNQRLNNVVDQAEVRELDKLLPCKPHGPSTLILTIQVNVFDCGGIAIGTCMNHKVCDAFSILMFINSWSSIARGDTNNESSCILARFDGAKQFPSTNNLSKFRFENDISVSKRFTFDKTSISSLIAKYNNNNGTDNLSSGQPSGVSPVITELKLKACRNAGVERSQVRPCGGAGMHGPRGLNPSSGLVLSAFIYSRIVATSKSNTNNVPYEVCRAVGIRSMINYVQDESFYFGNLYVNAIAKPSIASLVTDNGAKIYREMVDLMSEATNKIDSSFMASIRDGTQDLGFMTDHFERAQKGKIVSIGFSSYGSLPVYESDFGWGKPVWVTSATLAMKNVIILIPSRSRTRVDVYVCLIEEDMRNLECDQEFTLFAKKTLCSKL